MIVADGDAGGTVSALLFLMLLLVAYFLPTIVAMLRHVPNIGSIAVINTFLAWTVVGWVVALAMASRSMPQPMNVYTYQPGGRL